jgi:DNA replication and repair protein RecF
VHLERLELVDYRSYRQVQIALGPGVSVFVGANAQGKTNLLEAVHYLAVGGSHRVATDAPLVRMGAEAAVIRAVLRLTDSHRRVTVEHELRPGGRNRARLGGQIQPRARDALGVLRSVLFAPEDLALVRGEPAERRRFLDELLGQRRPAYAAARQDYERVLRQRNSLLKQLRGPGNGTGAAASLSTWTEQLVRTGATLTAARIAAVHALAGPAAEAYADLVTGAPGGKAGQALALSYELATGRTIAAEPGGGVPDPGAIAGELTAGVARVAAAERERGLTLVGPHRDDLRLQLGDLPAKGYASHGEGWSCALALRLASRAILHEVGDEPIVLLDDVFAELDDARRARLAARCADFEQVLVTAAVDADVPLAGPRYAVELGRVTPRDDAAAGRAS